MSYAYSARPRFSFAAKIALTLAGVVAGDWLFWDQPWGSTLGGAALAMSLGVFALHREIRRDRAALIAAAAAGALALVLIDRPAALAWLMFWTALTLAVLLPRARFDDAWRWFQRLAFHAFVATVGPLLDALLLRRLRRKARRAPLREAVSAVALPLVGGAVFLALFHMANPVISHALENFRLPVPNLLRAIFWGGIVVTLWGVLRPRRLTTPMRLTDAQSTRLAPGVTVVSVTLSLLVFNALFALQNGLDIAFLWSGAPLPDGVTMKEYVHRGAYPLIATAILAGLFVLVALRPGTATGQSPLIRRLVVAWVIQNFLLVASSALRTLEYIDATLLTSLRIAAIAWMGLVALGLGLILWRVLRGKSAAWLINTNALAAYLVLMISSALDFDAFAAAWNVRHAHEVGGRGAELDLCYLYQMGSPALIPLAELEKRPLSAAFAERVHSVRQDLTAKVRREQSRDWRAVTWRDQRRLNRARAIAGESFPAEDNGRRCDGYPYPSPQPTAATEAPSPLTSSQPS
jgi:hypothetical protein